GRLSKHARVVRETCRQRLVSKSSHVAVKGTTSNPSELSRCAPRRGRVPAGPPVEHALADPAWQLDPKMAEQLEETLATLTLKRRRFVKYVLARGSTLAGAVREAGYNVSTVRSATEVGRELLRDPRVAFCVQAITEAEGLSGAKLRAVLGHHLAGYDSPDGGDRDRSARIAALIYKQARPKPPDEASPGKLLDEIAGEELRRFAASGRWPARFAAHLGRVPSGACHLVSDTDGARGALRRSAVF